nr:hypothetical protein [Tanacetum cinerariifolium]
STSLRLFNRRDALVLVGTDGKAWIRQESGQKPFTELFTVNTPPKRSP